MKHTYEKNLQKEELRTNQSKKTVIIVAGGVGKRFGANIPKQFLLLNGKPILQQTITLFYNFDKRIEIFVVLPNNQISFWTDLCEKHNFNIQHKIVAGGSERFYSVKNGLEKISDTGLIAIHDSVRPFVSADVIKTGFELAAKKGNAIPVVEVKNSYRFVENMTNKQIDRTKLRIVQTPQIFQAKIIKEAYKQQFNKIFTDDASVIENIGHQINLYKGNEENIKITTKNDLKNEKKRIKLEVYY